MLVYKGTKARPVDVMGLARMVTRPIPPASRVNVLRPHLLTNQLRGCACASNGLSGLGQATDIALAIADAKHLWDELQAALGIGAGRREADVITPLQDKLYQLTLVPTSDMGARKEQYTCDQLNAALVKLNADIKSFVDFLRNTQWQDGRAAAQALYWAAGQGESTGQEPTAYLVQRDFTADVKAQCGSSWVTAGLSSSSLTWIGAAAVGLWALAKRR